MIRLTSGRDVVVLWHSFMTPIYELKILFFGVYDPEHVVIKVVGHGVAYTSKVFAAFIPSD